MKILRFESNVFSFQMIIIDVVDTLIDVHEYFLFCCDRQQGNQIEKLCSVVAFDVLQVDQLCAINFRYVN